MTNKCIVSFSHIRQNITRIHTHIPSSTCIMAVVKADAYGLGSHAICRYLIKNGIRHFGVATPEEAASLRTFGVTSSILLLQQPPIQAIPDLIRQSITFSVYSSSFITQLSRHARQSSTPVRVHLNIDTGMSRIGCTPTEAPPLIRMITDDTSLELEGVYSHFAQADTPTSAFNAAQLSEFNTVLHHTRTLHHRPIRHMANSHATTYIPSSHFDMVRIGIGLYQACITLQSTVSFLKSVPAHTPIGYGSHYITPAPCYIATIPIGYGDGIPTAIRHGGTVLINGHSHPIVGNICMDMMMVKIDPAYSDIHVGDTVTIIGTQKDTDITLDDVCAITRQNPREFLCGIGQRVTRCYV